MKIENTPLKDRNIVEFPLIEDSRGSFSRLFCINELRNDLKGKSIIQINQSKTLSKASFKFTVCKLKVSMQYIPLSFLIALDDLYSLLYGK